MDFPDYVPDGARSFARHLLQSSPELGLPGYEGLLTEWKAELGQIDSAIADRSKRLPELPKTEIPRSYEAKLTDLRKRRIDKIDAIHRLEVDLAVIRRLIYDARMQDVYTFFDKNDRDREVRLFLHSAFAAGIDYTRHRERVKQTREQTAEIAKTAEKLADLLESIGEAGPAEFYGVDDLLRKTDNIEDPYVWRSLRPTIVGDRSPADHNHVVGGPFLEPDSAEQARSAIQYCWSLAPPLSALLDTLANVARRYEPAERGFIGAAVAKRQRNIKTAYLRGFAHLLAAKHHFELTKPIMRAMATTANVVINDPDLDVGYDDVRKVVATSK